MATYLLTWNPNKYPWGNLQDELAQVRSEGHAADNWSVGNNTRIRPGDRFFMIRVGSEPRGLVASGTFTSEPREGPHWNRERAAMRQKARFAAIRFEHLDEKPVITRSELDRPPFKGVHWSSQMSGISIQPDIAAKLEEEWARRTGWDRGVYPEEVFGEGGLFPEGVRKRITVNAYERDRSARRACIDKHGYRCACCDVQLSELYGKAAERLIHVHHLKQLSTLGKDYEIDAVRDLAPVCPNCHAVIHSRSTPYSISEVREMLSAAKTR